MCAGLLYQCVPPWLNAPGPCCTMPAACCSNTQGTVYVSASAIPFTTPCSPVLLIQFRPTRAVPVKPSQAHNALRASLQHVLACQQLPPWEHLANHHFLLQLFLRGTGCKLPWCLAPGTCRGITTTSTLQQLPQAAAGAGRACQGLAHGLCWLLFQRQAWPNDRDFDSCVGHCHQLRSPLGLKPKRSRHQ
jgi:hypothetical protein